jgi:hypothetical protein
VQVVSRGTGKGGPWVVRDLRGLMPKVFPDVSLGRPIPGRDTLLEIDRGREVLGLQPAPSWLDAS